EKGDQVERQGGNDESCYRHPRDLTSVHCSICGRPICPDCMRPTSEGYACPEHGRERLSVRGRSIAIAIVLVLVVLAAAFVSYLFATQRGPWPNDVRKRFMASCSFGYPVCG